MQLGGVVVALLGLVLTYIRYAERGTFRSRAAILGRRVLGTINPKWGLRPRRRWSGVTGWGAEADARTYDLPPDTDEALRLLASYIQEDRAMLLEAKAESGHLLHEHASTDTRQHEAVTAGVRDYALGGIAITALGLILTAGGIVVPLF